MLHPTQTSFLRPHLVSFRSSGCDHCVQLGPLEVSAARSGSARTRSGDETQHFVDPYRTINDSVQAVALARAR